jgi:cell wall-associated NlpC family hydrolase
MTREDVIAAAKEVEGTPFKHQGRIPGLGMDCAGVLVHCFQRLGLPHEDAQGYPRNPFDGQLERILDGQPSLRRIAKAEMDRGDVLCMRISSAPQHIALYLGLIDGHPYILHGSSEHGKVATHRLDALWGARIVRVYRFEGLQ